MRAARLPGLSGGTCRYALVPIGKVEYLTIGCTVDLSEAVVVTSIVRSINVASSWNRASIEELSMR